MVMKSNSSSRDGELRITTSGAGANPTPPRVTVYPMGRSTVEFVCTPSPCHNGGGARPYRLPRAYSFTRTEKVEYQGYYTQTINKDMPAVSQTVDSRGTLTAYLGLPNVSVDIDNSAAAWNKCLTKFYAALKDSEASLNVTIGELKETRQLLTALDVNAVSVHNKLNKIYRQTRAEIRRNPTVWRTGSKKLAGMVLLVNLAIKPLISDIENLKKHALKNNDKGVEVLVQARASVQETYTKSGVTVDRNDRCEIHAIVEVVSPHIFENFRLGLTARPTLVWELVTLSFLVDYFYNIGGFLSNLEAAVLNNGVAIKSGYVTTGFKETRDFRIRSRSTSPTYDYVLSADAFERRVGKKRAILTSFPLPHLPTLKLPKASTQLLNIAALLTMFIKLK